MDSILHKKYEIKVKADPKETLLLKKNTPVSKILKIPRKWKIFLSNQLLNMIRKGSKVIIFWKTIDSLILIIYYIIKKTPYEFSVYIYNTLNTAQNEKVANSIFNEPTPCGWAALKTTLHWQIKQKIR